MLNKLKLLLDNCFPEEAETEDEHRTSHLAAAALMVEIATIDEHFDERELATLGREIERQFQLPQDGIKKLAEEARNRSKESTSLYDFTQHINSEFDQSEKFDLLVGMWRIAYADGR